MYEEKVGELFQKHAFLKESFQKDTDELMYYDKEQEIIYAYQWIDDGWENVFVMTDCRRRWTECIHPEDGERVQKFLGCIEKGEKQSEMVCRFEKDGQYFWYFSYLCVIEEESEAGQPSESIILGYRRDLCLVSAGASGCCQSTMDFLTKVYKKDVVQERIDESIGKYQAQQGVFCLLDLDQFHIINEKYGYKAGDNLLCDLVKTIRKNVSTADIIGRVGSDTFVLYMNDVTGEKYWKQTIANIIFQIRQLYRDSSMYYQISASAGVALYPEDGKNYVELFEKAKEARGFARLSQFGGFEIYEKGMLRSNWEERFFEQTGQKQEWQQLQGELFEKSLSVKIDDLFQQSEDYGNSISVLLSRIGAKYGLAAAQIYEYLPDKKVMCCTYEWLEGKDSKNIMEIGGISDENVANKMLQVRHGGTVQLYSDNIFFREHRKEIPDIIHKKEAGLVVELVKEDRYLGRMLLLRGEKDYVWSQRDLYELEEIGKLLSYMFYNGIRQKLEEREWKEKKYYDPLTCLYQMDIFLDKTRHYLARHSEKQYLLVYSDIRNFKYVNETFGYEVGDNVLREWADILIKDVPNSIFAGRVYYDHVISLREVEFGLSEEEIIKGLNETKSRIEHQIKKNYPGSNVTLNTGAFCLRGESMDISAALSYANMARKLAKNSSVGCMLYTDAMRKQANREIALVSGLEDAIKNREFLVYLQPKVGCKSQKVVGAEALVRWQKQSGEVIYPDEFIGVFEKYGCIVEVDYYVYEEVFRFVRRRIEQGKPIIPISLNVSRAHMSNTKLIDKIEYLLEKYKIPTKAIEFEITESLYMEKFEALDQVLAYFRKRGFILSMDDFGKGYSSLNAISTMPVDVIKMDRIFMKEDGLRENDRIIITHIITMANELQKKVLCEGVETDEQKAFIASVGCDSWQGFLFSKPVPIPEFEDMILHKEIQAI